MGGPMGKSKVGMKNRANGGKLVALTYPVSVPWMAMVFRGATDYAREHGGWDFVTSPPTLSGSEELALTMYSLKGWPGDGVIAAISDPAEAEAAGRLKIPVVNIAGGLRECALPRVAVDHYAVGRMAAEHLLECGLRRLAYYGLRGLSYSDQREQGFKDRAQEAGTSCEVFDSLPCSDPYASWHQRTAPLDRWLKKLPKPIGILAVHDYRARVVLDECQRLGIRVPHEVAVVGVDNDPTVCEFCRPTLSSVSRSAWKVGYEAAALLDRLMNGQAPPKHDTSILPEGVVARQSTDTIAVDDPHVTAAVRFMKDHLGKVFGMEEVLKHVDISRRSLETQFQQLLRCSPYEYLCRLRVERAKQLLAGPGRLKLHRIASASGFSSSARMRGVFQRLTGVTPIEYRQSLRRGAASVEGFVYSPPETDE
jgi:LacI family transcriptional regulator